MHNGGRRGSNPHNQIQKALQCQELQVARSLTYRPAYRFWPKPCRIWPRSPEHGSDSQISFGRPSWQWSRPRPVNRKAVGGMTARGTVRYCHGSAGCRVDAGGIIPWQKMTADSPGPIIHAYRIHQGLDLLADDLPWIVPSRSLATMEPRTIMAGHSVRQKASMDSESLLLGRRIRLCAGRVAGDDGQTATA